MATIKYFNGDIELKIVKPVNNDVFLSLNGVKSKHNYYDSFKRLIGSENDKIDQNKIWLPVTRKVEYKSKPSLHKCDARCQNSKGHVCECECGGKYHGINA